MEWHTVTKKVKKVAIIASGLSIKHLDFKDFKNDGYIICVNDSWRKYNNPDVVVSIDTVRLDKRFADCPHKIIVGVPPGFGTQRAEYRNDKAKPKTPLLYMKRHLKPGLAEDKDSLHSGESSGYGAINLAYHMDPEYLFLFGLDLYHMGKHCHAHSDKRIQAPDLIARLPDNYATAVPQIERKGIKVINGSKNSNVPYFARVTPEEAIQMWSYITP